MSLEFPATTHRKTIKEHGQEDDRLNVLKPSCYIQNPFYTTITFYLGWEKHAMQKQSRHDP